MSDKFVTDTLREALREIESLRQQLHEVALDWQVTQQQLNILKDELKLISKTIDDPRVDLTMTMREVILEMKQQLSDHIKRKMILRSAIGAWDRAEPDELQAAECGLLKALAATDDLKDVRLCHAEPIGWCGTSGVGELIVSKSKIWNFLTTPLYRAWEPK